MTNCTGKKTPPHIKWLLNERAMLQGELRRLATRLPAYKERLDAAQAVLEQERATLSRAQRAYKDTLQKIQALAITVESMAPEVNPDAVGPVNAWAGKYGKRGTLIAFLKEHLRHEYPDSLTLPEICLAVQTNFGLVLSASFERKNLRDSIRARLCECRAQGLVESLDVPLRGARGSTWRWRSEPSTFEMLRHQEAQRDEDP